MDEVGVSSKLFEAPVDRRLWLLHKALECMPLDRAIALARDVEEFLTEGAPVSSKLQAAQLRSESGAALPENRLSEKPDSVGSPAPSRRPATQTRLALSHEQRERLMDRFRLLTQTQKRRVHVTQ